MRYPLYALVLVALFASACPAQAEAGAEEDALRRAVGEAGSSPIEFMRVLEAHLEKYPNSPRKEEIERAIVKAAIEARDNTRILKFGERVLARDSGDVQIVERVARALLADESREAAEKALKYARILETGVEAVWKERAASDAAAAGKARLREQADRLLAKALVFQSRAQGTLGKLEEAVALARRSYQVLPTAEAAREAARWLSRQNKDLEALRHLADAFTVADGVITEEERAVVRQRMGELYRKSHPNESGLGDLILEAYDRNSALVSASRARLRELDPNSGEEDPLRFTLTGADGDKIQLSTLRGKAVVMEFWATWCGPCRAQKPLYDQVKERFKNNADVAFLAINIDEDRSLVKPFLQAQRWNLKTWYDDGLALLLRVSSIPTTVVLDRRGQIVSRLNGFIPERFVDMLTERIQIALKK